MGCCMADQDLINQPDTVVIELQSALIGQKSLIENLRSIDAPVRSFLDSVVSAAEKYGVSTESGTILVTRRNVLLRSKELKRGSSTALFSRRMGSLLAIDLPGDRQVCKLEVLYKTSSRDRFHHYKLNDLSALISLPQLESKKAKGTTSRRSKEIVRVQKDLFRADQAAIYLETGKELKVHFHEQFFNGVLDTAMRMSHKDSRRQIDVTYVWKGRPLQIRSTCSSGEDSSIAILTDQRAQRPIIAYCKREIAKRKKILREQLGDGFHITMIINSFRIDIHDLCKHMGMTNAAENIAAAAQMMRRLADTTYRVDARENKEFQELFSLRFGDDDVASDLFEFRFLQNLDITLDQPVADLFGTHIGVMRPRFYTFSLDPRLFYSLVLDNSSGLFLSHIDLAREQSGIVQRFYNWSRFWFSGPEKRNLNSYWYSMRDMHDLLMPAARYDNFRRHFIAALEKFQVHYSTVLIASETSSQPSASNADASPTEFAEIDDAINFGGDAVSETQSTESVPTLVKSSDELSETQPLVTIKAKIYGFFVHYQKRKDGEYLRVEKDPDDPIVGNNSKHKQLVRQNLLEDKSNVELGEYAQDPDFCE